MKRIYTEFQETRHLGDDFLRWLLIRKLKGFQQLILIGTLIVIWLLVAPYLTFWLWFFKASLAIIALSLIGSLFFKIKK